MDYLYSHCRNHKIICQSSTEELVIPFNRLLILGEYTNEEGPFLDDHFLVLVTKDKEVVEIVFNLELLRKLEIYWSLTLQLSLSHITTLDSRILYPTLLMGSPLYNFVPIKYSFRQHPMLKILRIEQYEKRLSDVALEYIKENVGDEAIYYR